MQELDKEISPWIGRISKILDSYHSRKLKENGFDLTKEQWVLLKVLSFHNGVSQNEIACLTHRDKTAVTRLVNTAEKKNLIARIVSKDDKRINLLYLTKQGEKMLQDTEQIRMKVVSDIESGITIKESQIVIGVLKKMQNNVLKTEGCKCN